MPFTVNGCNFILTFFSIAEFASYGDMKTTIKNLDGTFFDGKKIKLKQVSERRNVTSKHYSHEENN